MNYRKKNRVMVLGLDGATLKVIGPFARKGIMPHMKRILDHCAAGPLWSVTPPVTGPAWASFLTGKQPGKHGLYDFVKCVPGHVTRKPVNYTDIKSPTLLSLVGNAKGRSVCFFNVPITYPPPEINGFVVTGMLTPDTDVQFTYPEILKRKLETKFGPYILDVFWQRFSDDTAEQFICKLIEYEKQKLDVAKELFSEKPWDLFMAVFTGTDRIQHALWHVIEAILDGSKLIPRQERLKPLIKDYYALLDRGLADLINAAGKETTVLFMSDHGFGPLKKKFYINSWLQEKGWLSYDADLVRRVNRKKSFKAILKQYLMRFPVVQEFIARRGTLPLRKRMQAYQFLDFIHWSRTQAFSVSNTEQGIYINLKGREPRGVINPGKEYETLRDSIMDALRSLHNPENGQPLVSHLYKKEELYHGPYMNHAPDIVFFLGEGEYLADVRLTDYLWEDLSWITGRGTHRKDGLFIAYGNGVRKGINVEANIVDLAPTVLFLLNRPIPEDIDGSILTSVFESDFLSARTPQFEAVKDTMEEGRQPFSLSQEEEKKVFSNLKDLGYM